MNPAAPRPEHPRRPGRGSHQWGSRPLRVRAAAGAGDRHGGAAGSDEGQDGLEGQLGGPHELRVAPQR